MADLLEAFKRVQHQYPVLFSGASYLQAGHYGLAVSHNDGTVSKLMLRKDDVQQRAYSERELEKEVANLRLLSASGMTGFKIPELLSDVTELESPDFYATYRMTEISGHQAKWEDGQLTAKQEQRYFRQSGEVLAEFHQKATSLPGEWVFTHDPERGGNFPYIEILVGRNLTSVEF